ncbi:MGMT family protein [Acetobacterium wieringae]|uniref:MGMT family protein n=1 Tax=Acetobacterium wieringae TaxID=52694 RepID=UPI0026E97C5D|nr:MGMT family protein [Acetobacterium wieringae]
MATETFNQKLQDSKDLPKISELTDPKAISRYGGTKLLIAPALAYDEIMKKIPEGKIVTSDYIRAYLAKVYGADNTCPLTAGIFINIVAKASEEREEDETPYWRTLKKDGELNEKYPGGIAGQRCRLEAEGHTIVQKGKKYFVKDYQDKVYALKNA